MVVAGTTTPNHRTTSFGAKSTTTTPSNFRSQSNPKRPPLLPSEKDNTTVATPPTTTNNCGYGGIPGQQRRPKSREVNSRYLSTSSSSSTSNSSSSTSLSNSSFFSSSPSARRCASPVPSRPRSSSGLATPVANSAVVNRTQSVERRRPSTPKPRIPGEMSAAAKLLMSSSRSLSVSFQGESYAVPRAKIVKPLINKPSPSVIPSLRKGIPERIQNAVTPMKGGENSRPSDQPWPGRVVSMSRSVDLGCEGKKLSHCGSGKVVRALQESLASCQNLNRISSTLRRSLDKDCESVNVGCGNVASALVSDAESVSTEGNSGSQDSNSNLDNVVGRSRGAGNSIMRPPRCWQETKSLSKCGSEPVSPLANTSSLKGTVLPKLVTPRKFVTDSPGASPRGALNNRGLSSPLRGTMRPASPSKLASTLPASPSKLASTRPATPGKLASTRPATPSKLASTRPASPGKFTSARPASPSIRTSERAASPSIRTSVRPASPSIHTSVRAASPGRIPSVRPASPRKLTAESSPSRGMGRVASPSRVRNVVGGAQTVPFYGTDVRRVKVGDNRLGDAHLLRILHNRHLQWRFVNARAEASLSMQQLNAERCLYKTWVTTLDLRGEVSSKRTELQWLKQKLKLLSGLKDQIVLLEQWALMDVDHCDSLSGAIESIKASTIRLPLVAGATVDIQDLKEAICSAADVMHSMAASICSLLQRVEEVNSLMAEVAGLTAKEHSFLNDCRDTLSMLAAMQVKDCSLKAHVLQLKCAPSSLAVEV